MRPVGRCRTGCSRWPGMRWSGQRADGREFYEASIIEIPLERWPGADVVTISSVVHHLDDEQVVSLLEDVSEKVKPKRILIQDAEPISSIHGFARTENRRAENGVCTMSWGSQPLCLR